MKRGRKEENIPIIPERFDYLRKMKNMNYRQLSEECNASIDAIKNIKRRKCIPKETLEKIAVLYDFSPGYLTGKDNLRADSNADDADPDGYIIPTYRYYTISRDRDKEDELLKHFIDVFVENNYPGLLDDPIFSIEYQKETLYRSARNSIDSILMEWNGLTGNNYCKSIIKEGK
jgi:transcriptional regulator with XRE-family HTH domain